LFTKYFITFDVHTRNIFLVCVLNMNQNAVHIHVVYISNSGISMNIYNI